jgi:lipopolysaccharide biosynthesis glycosyltransferase
MKINIALAISRDWFEYAVVTATSILENSNSQDEYCFYILSNGFSDEEKDLFLKLKKLRDVDFKFVTLDDSYFDNAIHDWLGVSASYRLRLQTFCPEDKVLYLDSDIVALKDLSELFNTDITDYYVAAVEDKSGHMMRCRIKSIKEDEPFFNSGVQLINLNKFRENKLEEKFMEALRSHGIYTDQDAMNDVCYGNILSLPLKYNIVPCEEYKHRRDEAVEAIADPVLLHYWSKPWQASARINRYKDWYKYKDIYDNL